MKHSVSIALWLAILLPHPLVGRAQGPPATDEAQRIKNFKRVMDAGSYQEKNKAILELSWPKSERAAEALLQRLKQNLANNQGAQVYPWSGTSGGMFLWGSYPSENALLVAALARQEYAGAVPTLRKLFKVKRERRGITPYNLAYYINQITGRPVEYEENGEKKRFPEPKP